MLCGIASCGEGRAESSLMTREATFGLGAVAILPQRESIMHHTSISSLGRTGCISPVDGDHCTADAKLTPAQCMIMLRIIAFVCQHTLWTQIACGLTHRGCKVGRVLARAQTNNRSRERLRLSFTMGDSIE